MIFDAHHHFSDSIRFELKDVVGKNVIFNTVAEYLLRREKILLPDTTSLIFDFKDDFAFCKHEIENKKLHALKIHTRHQKITKQQYPLLLNKLTEAQPGIPIIIDAFYHGSELECQPSVELILQIAKAFPHNTVIVAHAGGHKVLDYQLHLRDLKNIFFDLSFSLEYLRHTSAFEDFKNLIRYSRRKLLFGTDFPNASPQAQFTLLNDILSEQQVPDDERHLLFAGNALNIFKPSSKTAHEN